MLTVIVKDSTIEGDASRANVVVESDAGKDNFAAAFDELDSRQAVQFAMGWAVQQGVAPARLNGNPSSTYPVNSEGLPLDKVVDSQGKGLPQTHPRMQPHRYRRDFPVCQPI